VHRYDVGCAYQEHGLDCRITAADNYLKGEHKEKVAGKIAVFFRRTSQDSYKVVNFAGAVCKNMTIYIKTTNV